MSTLKKRPSAYLNPISYLWAKKGRAAQQEYNCHYKPKMAFFFFPVADYEAVWVN